MNLTKDQAQAYDKIMHWVKNSSSQFFRLAGYAGTGKTTLLQFIINGLDEIPYCCAPTGKAASVLEKKLDLAMVTTVHKALYSPIVQSTERLEALVLSLKGDDENKAVIDEIKEEKLKLSKTKIQFSSKLKRDEYKGMLFIVDEASMVSGKMARDFEYSGARVLFVGDPGQLPPVGDSGWFGGEQADFTLTTVMRQALENPIIRLSMDIRINGYVNESEYKDCEEVIIAHKSEIAVSEWVDVDQVLTGTNYLRRRINRFLRKQHGFDGELPQEGEKLICLKNNMDGYGFINGVPAICKDSVYLDEFGQHRTSVYYDENTYDDIAVYDAPFLKHYHEDAKEEPYQLRYGLCEFDWAYAITVHKSQGSEFNKVLLADDNCFNRRKEERKQWLYTAVTRAKNKLIWCKG